MLKRLIVYITVLLFLVITSVISVQSVSLHQLDERIISDAVILIDGDTGQVLYEKNMHKVLRPASITKVMTALLALENGNLDDTIVMTRNALRPIEPTAAIINLVSGEELTLEDALYAMAVVSAADASNGIAEHIGGTVSAFVRSMNQRAKELGALNTNFVNPHGMPDNNHLTTAYDMALISMAAVNTPGFNEIFSTRRYEMPPTNRRATPRIFRNLNRMMDGAYEYKDLIAGKTGWTRSSEYTLFAAAERDGRTLVGIAIKSPLIDDKYEDMTQMFDFGFAEFDKIGFTAEELVRYFIAETNRSDIEIDFYNDDEEVFSCFVHKSYSKNYVKIHFVIEEVEIDETLTDEDEIDELDIEDNDTETKVQIRMMFSMIAPASWTGVRELGELTVPARIIEPVIEDEPVIENTPEPLETPEPTEVIPEETEPEDPEPVDDEINGGVIAENHNWKTVLLRILKDTGFIFVCLVVLICYIINSKRRRRG